jgi:hypothetical protein
MRVFESKCMGLSFPESMVHVCVSLFLVCRVYKQKLGGGDDGGSLSFQTFISVAGQVSRYAPEGRRRTSA